MLPRMIELLCVPIAQAPITVTFDNALTARMEEFAPRIVELLVPGVRPANAPTMVFLLPSLLRLPAPLPISVLLLPDWMPSPAALPKNELLDPGLFMLPAPVPKKALPLPVFWAPANGPAKILSP